MPIDTQHVATYFTYLTEIEQSEIAIKQRMHRMSHCGITEVVSGTTTMEMKNTVGDAGPHESLGGHPK